MLELTLALPTTVGESDAGQTTDICVTPRTWTFVLLEPKSFFKKKHDQAERPKSGSGSVCVCVCRPTCLSTRAAAAHLLCFRCWHCSWRQLWRGRGDLSEMDRYVTGTLRIVPVCLTRLRGQCDVQSLTVFGPYPEKHRSPTVPPRVPTPSPAHTWKHFSLSQNGPEYLLGANLSQWSSLEPTVTQWEREWVSDVFSVWHFSCALTNLSGTFYLEHCCPGLLEWCQIFQRHRCEKKDVVLRDQGGDNEGLQRDVFSL